MSTPQTSAHVPPSDFTPSWARRAIWYQIVPERFCNGDRSNDPTLESLVGSHFGERAEPWQIHPWGSDWYELAAYERARGGTFWDHVYRRRYGGDLQGILDKLPYLEDLGVNALYLTPVFESPSLHKYDGATYHHIDPHFGPDPEGDRAAIAREVPHDPATWVWTSADRLMLELVAQVHRRGMRIIFDGVFNHMGRNSWALRDLLARGQNSPYRDWFKVQSWGDPSAGVEPTYQGWWGHSTLPELRQDDAGLVEGPRRYVLAAVERWMAPDGRAADGIDGWRLDVAALVKAGFWRELRSRVRELKPEAFLTAEIIDELDRLPEFLQGDQFDAVMGYPFAFACHEFFFAGQRACAAQELDRRLAELRHALPGCVPPVLQNLFGSHDTARLASHVVNGEHLTYREFGDYAQRQARADSPGFSLRAPTAAERELQLLFALFQMTYLGAPMIYYGDEAGLWGANDPCCRKPMLWPENEHAPESFLPDGTRRATPDPVRFDAALHARYRRLIWLRRRLSALSDGDYQTLVARGRVLAFARRTADQHVVVVINAGEVAEEVALPPPRVGAWRDALADDRPVGTAFMVTVAPRSGRVLWA